MAVWGPVKLTNKGQALAGKLAGNAIPVTIMKIGQGTWTTPDDPSLMTDLEDIVVGNISVTIANNEAGVAVIKGVLSNEDVAIEFQAREAGIYADDPDDGEILYAAAYAGDQGDTFPAYNGSNAMQAILSFNTSIGNAISAVPVYVDPELEIIRQDYLANTILKADADDTPVALEIPEETILGRITGGNIAALSVAQVKELLELGSVLKEVLFSDNSILKADVAENPGALAVAEKTLLGRVEGGNIDALDAQSVKAILYGDSDLSSDVDITINPDDDYREYVFNEDATADGVFTFNTLSASHDGKEFIIRNKSWFMLQMKPPSTVKIGPSGTGFGIEMPKRGWVKLRYNHSESSLEIIGSSGVCQIENCDLYIPMEDPSSNYARDGILTVTSAPSVVYNEGLQCSFSNNYFDLTSSGTLSKIADYTNKVYDVITIAGWAKPSVVSGFPIFQHYLQGGYYSNLTFNSGGGITFDGYENYDGFSIYNFASFSANELLHLAIVFKNGNIGCYKNGVQLGWLQDADWNAFSRTGNLRIGRYLSSSAYFQGLMADWVFCRQNLFNADPQSDLSDVITIPQSPKQKMNLVGF